MDCICLTDGLTSDQIEQAKKSTSGLYLDTDLSGGVKLADVKYLDSCGEFFRIATESIEAAQRDFSDDFRVALLTKYKSAKTAFMGELGRLQYSGFMPATKPIQYVRIEPSSTGGGIMKIDTVRININASKLVKIKMVAVMDGLTYGDTVFEAEVNTVANKWTNVVIPDSVSVPLTMSGRKMNYYLAWEKTGAELPVDNSTSCGCSGGDGYSSFVKLFGGQADSYEDLTKYEEKLAHGFSIGAQISCDTGNVVCDLLKTSELFKLVTPKAILFKAGANMINNILKSSEISRITMMNREVMWGSRNHFIKEYETRISYLASEVTLGANDCFTCSTNSLYVGNVFG